MTGHALQIWRIASAAHARFDGEGARLYGSRWTPRGFPAIYASATLSLAALERLIHTDPDLEPADLVAIAIEVADDVTVETVDVEELPEDWRRYPPPESLANVGRRWLEGVRSAVLSVPSVVIPHERNYVLNPVHPDFTRLKIGRPRPFAFDPRLWQRRGR